MKKLLIVNIICLYSFTSYCQNVQQNKIDIIKDKVVKYFNNQNADSLYSLAGKDFKKQLNEEIFKTICNTNLFPLGKIKLASFEKFENGVSKYKTEFDAATLSMFISLDDEDLLNIFLFKPYKKQITGLLGASKTDNKLSTPLDKKIDSLLQQFMFSSNTVGLSMGILKNGKKYFYNYGETKKNNKEIPTSKNLYEIGSITKTFTGLLLAKAVIENKINLNDPVNKYLPKDIPTLQFEGDTLRIVHLSNHTSGLPPLPTNFDATNSINPYKDYDNDKLNAYLKVAKLSRKPGEKFEYCNLAVGLLGNILESINKMPFEKMVQNFICSKTDMNNTKQFLTKTDSSLFVQGYNEDIDEQSQWDFKALAAAGCIRSNTEDILKYAVLNLNATVNELQSAVELEHVVTFTKGEENIGLNWFIREWGWGKIYFHNGGTGGYRSFLAINPKTKNAVIILSNTAISNDKIGVEILKYIDKK